MLSSFSNLISILPAKQATNKKTLNIFFLLFEI